MTKQPFPAGWDESRVQRLIDHYEKMDEDTQVLEDEAGAETRQEQANGPESDERKTSATTSTDQVLKAIDKAVSFQYPGAAEPKVGILKDRVVVPGESDVKGVKYLHVVDLIEFQNQPQPEWMRFGYFKESDGKLQWASRSALTATPCDWKSLFIQAAKEKPWFKKLLEDVMAEL